MKLLLLFLFLSFACEAQTPNAIGFPAYSNVTVVGYMAGHDLTNDSNVTIVGAYGESTQSNQVVLSAGKDYQWRFNSDGSMYLNDSLISCNIDTSFNRFLRIFIRKTLDPYYTEK